MGNLGADPELRYTQNNTAVANIRLATNESYKTAQGDLQEATEWHRLVLWGRLAEIANEHLSKGSRVYITGKLQTRSWEDSDGVKRYSTEVNVGRLKFVDRAATRSGQGPLGKEQEAGISDLDPNEKDDLPF